MANFAVAASPETIEKANKIMEIYAQNGDKKEDTLLRILDLAEAESVKGTHPALEPNLKAIEKTLGSLLKQINGIVAGQDIQLAEAKEKLEDKREARDKEKLEKYIDNRLEYTSDCIALALTLASEAKLSFLEALEAQAELDDK